MSDFKSDYENFCIKLSEHLPQKLKNELIDKRIFGLSKYGDISYQSSFVNAMKVKTVQHAREELIDLLNYLLHETYKAEVLKDHKRKVKILKIFNKSIKIYKAINKMDEIHGNLQTD